MKKLMTIGILVTILFLGYGLHLTTLNAGILSIERMSRISAGEGEVPQPGRACVGSSSGCGENASSSCGPCTEYGQGCGHMVLVLCVPSRQETRIAHKICSNVQYSSSCNSTSVACSMHRSCALMRIDPQPAEPPYYECVWDDWAYSHQSGCY